jgi:hypothetical protein
MNSTLARLGALLLAAAVIPACSGGKRVAPTLFSEGFDAGFPSTNWSAPVVTGSATAAVDGANGFPAPSLKMSTTAATATVKTDTLSSFNNPSVTFSLTMATLSGGTTQLGSGSVSILDATPAVAASASWDNATGLVTFHIVGATDATAPLASDGNFHRFVFSVGSTGTASWSLDNGAPMVTKAAFPGGLLKIELSALFGAGTAWPSFFFDNVVVTTP